MVNIENTYSDYTELTKAVKPEVIESRLLQLNQEMSEFLESNKLVHCFYVNQMLLTHAVMDYFSDIQRLKDYQEIERANEMKIKAYETFWLLQRKPIQLKGELEDDSWLYINEKFLLTRLTSYMLQDDMNVPLIGETRTAFKNYLDTVYYYLKFRRCDAQSIELMLLAFKAGTLIGGAHTV